MNFNLIFSNLIKKTLFACLLFAFIFGVFFTSSAFAADSSGDNNVVITPAKFDISLSQGDTVENYFRIYNHNNYDVLVSLKLENIGIVREDGEVVIGGSHSGYPSILQDWLKFEPEAVTVKPGQANFIKMTIKVPDNAGYGGRYSSVIAKTARVESADNNNTTATLASLIMLTIVGDTRNSASVESFSISAQNNNNFALEIKVHNTGNDHIKPSGMLVVSDVFGKKIDEIVFDGDNVLPGAVRKSELTWESSKRMFGIYNVTLIANYGYNNDGKITANKLIIAKPWLFWSLTLFLILVLSIIVYFSIKLVKKFKKRRDKNKAYY